MSPSEGQLRFEDKVEPEMVWACAEERQSTFWVNNFEHGAAREEKNITEKLHGLVGVTKEHQLLENNNF